MKKAKERIQELLKGKLYFMDLSRKLAEKAQDREIITKQPKEYVEGEKGKLTITNYLGGHYYLTVDEVFIEKDCIKLIEAKHTNNKKPSKLNRHSRWARQNDSFY